MPETNEALLETVDRLAHEGQGVEAIAQLKAALARQPRAFSLWLRLSRLHYEAGEFRDALTAMRKAERADPMPEGFTQIQQAIQSRRYEDARAMAEAMLEKVPGHPRAVFTLAHLARARGDHEKAAAQLSDSFSHAPANPVLRELHISALEDSGNYAAAVEAARDLAQLDDSFGTIHRLLTVLLRYGQNEEALALCDRAEVLAANDAGALSEVFLMRGQLLRILGIKGASIEAFHESLRLYPAQAAAWWGLADLKTYGFTDNEKAAMRELLTSSGINRQQKAQMAFAFARAADTPGDQARAMKAYTSANTLQASFAQNEGRALGPRFDRAQFSAAIKRLEQGFDRAALKVQAGRTAAGPTPIFILGLPRSGSTLLEQILASHSQVEGTMELPVLPSIKRRAHKVCADTLGGDYLDKIGQIPAADLTVLGQQYINDSAMFRAEGAPYFTDKLPHNFEHVGLIHKMLPHAIIIDVRRNPLDCGLSLYKQYFASGVGFSYDLGDIGAYYNGYLSLMDHWDKVLPGRVHRVNYEELVTEPDRVIRGLLESIGLGFESACLSFHETERAVRTASSEQVRQPLNSAGIGQWRAVESYLTELKDSLGEKTLARFSRLG